MIEDIQVQPLQAHPQERNRFTAVINVYHEQAGEQPRQVSLSYSEILTTNQESYSRRLRATSQWSKLDLGWLSPDDVGYITIENLEGKRYSTNPTEEQKAETAKHVLEIAYEGALDYSWPIPSRGFLPIFVERAGELRIRCREGELAQYRINVVPR